MNNSEILTSVQAARHLKISDKRLKRLIHKGILATLPKTGRSYYIQREALERLLKEGVPYRVRTKDMVPPNKKSLAYCQQLADTHGGKCVSTEYKSRDVPLMWSCEHGHVFKSYLSNIQRGSWCKTCFLEGGGKRRRKVRTV